MWSRNAFGALRIPKQFFLKKRTPKVIRSVSTSKSSSDAPQPIFLEKSKEDPVIVISEDDDVDIIGPPHSVSNLRPIIRKKLLFETPLQKQLRKMQDETQEWNQEFWVRHNTNFVKQRQAYINLKRKTVEDLPSADEMSEFYKKFLDENWERHLKYNFEWYRKNFALLILAFRVSVEKSVTKMKILQ